MQEVRYYLADDGKRFYDHWECIHYERMCELEKHKNDFKFYNWKGEPILIPIDKANVEDVHYVVVKTTDAADAIEWWFDQEEMRSPFEGCGVGYELGTWYFDGDYDRWIKLEDKIAELQDMLETIQRAE